MRRYTICCALVTRLPQCIDHTLSWGQRDFSSFFSFSFFFDPVKFFSDFEGPYPLFFGNTTPPHKPKYRNRGNKDGEKDCAFTGSIGEPSLLALRMERRARLQRKSLADKEERSSQ